MYNLAVINTDTGEERLVQENLEDFNFAHRDSCEELVGEIELTVETLQAEKRDAGLPADDGSSVRKASATIPWMESVMEGQHEDDFDALAAEEQDNERLGR